MVVIYASITFALYCFTCVDAMQSSRFYTFDKVPKVCRVNTPLTAYCPITLLPKASVWDLAYDLLVVTLLPHLLTD